MNRDATIFAEHAWLERGWAPNVRLTARDGHFVAIETGQMAGGGDIRVDAALPGLVNAHSHAFQRALVAQTEAPSLGPGGAGATSLRAGPVTDSFWSWRDGMYRLAARISPDALRVVARQLYAELLAGGYTSVVEFHYLFADAPDAMLQALAGAASDVGIRLVWVPVLYAYSGFGGAPPTAGQRPFVLAEEDYMAHLEAALRLEGTFFRVGAGVHSLRAASMDMTRRVADWARRHKRPMHLHIAEQPREVDDCLTWAGKRPVAWLLGEVDVDAAWCLVHATHMDADETETLARTGAVVCVCPTTEANLGDGFFSLAPWLRAGGALAIGSDSQVGTNAYEELRWLEYGQRLLTGARNVASGAVQPATGFGNAAAGDKAVADVANGNKAAADVLFSRVLRGGCQAAGLLGGRLNEPGLAVGAPADLVAFGLGDARFAGHSEHTWLSALVFSAEPPRADFVMTGGRVAVQGGACRHLPGGHATEFARIMGTLNA